MHKEVIQHLWIKHNMQRMSKDKHMTRNTHMTCTDPTRSSTRTYSIELRLLDRVPNMLDRVPRLQNPNRPSDLWLTRPSSPATRSSDPILDRVPEVLDRVPKNTILVKITTNTHSIESCRLVNTTRMLSHIPQRTIHSLLFQHYNYNYACKSARLLIQSTK